jgi:hypothetical protein
MNTDLQCPSCRRLDEVVRVRAAYENATADAPQYGFGGTVKLGFGLTPTFMHSNGSAVSGLSQKLDPLEERPDTSYGWSTFLVAMILLLCAVAVASGAPIPAPMRIVVICIGVLAAVVWFILVKREVGHQRTVVLPWWESYMDLWSKVYYCGRCNVVFDPNRPDEAVDVSRMHDYLLSCVGKRP